MTSLSADARLIVTGTDDDAAVLRTVPLRARFKLLYGAGAIVEGTTTAALTFFLLFYLTSVCGMPGTLAGTALLIGLLVDAVADPVIGLLSDNTRSKLGRRFPYLLFSILPLALCFVLVFTIPGGLRGAALFGYATVCAIVLRVGLSLYNLPYAAVGAEVTDNYNERSSIVAYRISFTMLGTFAAIALGLGVFMAGTNGLLNRSAYAPFAISCAVLVVVGGAAGAWATRIAKDRLHQPPPVATNPVEDFFRDLRDVLRNRSFLTIFIAVLAFFVAQGMAGALAIHLNQYFWRLSSNGVQLVLIGATLGPLLGAPVAALLAHRIEKKTLTVGGFLLFALAQMWAPLARMGGVLPAEAQTLVIILFFSALIGGMGLVGAAIGGQSMMADATDEHELRFGARREALFFSGFMLASKAASGLGGFFAGLMLDLIHFQSGKSAIEMSNEMSRNLALVAGPLPALITLIAPVAIMGNRLSRRRHADILMALRDRHPLTNAALSD